MSDLERMDFSALDPGRDPERWSRLMDATRLRVEAALADRAGATDALDILGAWYRPILAAAAAVALMFGAADAAIAGRGAALEGTSHARRLAALSDNSLGRGFRPSGAALMVALGSRSVP